MADYKLYYFPARGRAELTRLLFVAGGGKFEDIHISMSEWPEKKKSFPTGQLPVLEVKGQKLTQSLAIARYVAKTFGLAGKSDMDQALVDQIVYTMNDLLSEYLTISFQQDQDKKNEMLKTFMTEYVPKKLDILEGWLKENNDGNSYFVGSSLTMADLAVYEDLTSVLQKDTNLLDKYPKLTAHRQRIAGSPRIKEYLAKRPTTEF